MKNRIFLKLIFSLLLLLFLALNFNEVNIIAANSPPSTGQNFTATLILPDNQIEGKTGAFHLLLNEQKRQTLKVELRNLTDQPLIIESRPANAFTNVNGDINYESNDGNTYSNLTDEKFLLNRYIKMNDITKLKSKETKLLEIEINYPELDRGTILGGFLLKEVGSETIDKSVDEYGNAIEIAQEVMIGYSIRADYGEVFEKQEVALNGNSVSLTSSGLQIHFHLENKLASIPNGIYFEYGVYDKKGNLLYEDKVNEFKMAPKSQFAYSLFWPNNDFRDGTYIIKTSLYVDGKSHPYEYEIVINETKLKESINDEPITIQWPEENKVNWLLIILATIAISSTLLFLRKKTMEEKDHNQEVKTKKTVDIDNIDDNSDDKKDEQNDNPTGDKNKP